MRIMRNRQVALRRGHAMASDTKATVRSIRIVVSRDHLQAWIESPAGTSPFVTAPSHDEIVAALTAKGIEPSEAVHERIHQYLEIVGRASPADTTPIRSEVPERFLIAEGSAPVEAIDGRFEWNESFSQRAERGQGDAPVDYYTRSSILTIEANTLVGRVVPPTDGQAGRDIFGKELAPQRGKGLAVKVGHGLRAAAADPQQVVTEVAGCLVHEGHTIRMSEVLKIPRDVDFASGNIDSVVDVHVCGGVKPNFSVKTTKSLTIERAAEAAELDAGGDIQVRGGLFGHESGHLIKAGGSITASICDAAEVEAAGDICIAREIINSRLRTRGEIRIEHGAIIGGEIFARNGVKLKHAGSTLGVPTRIAVGTDGVVLHRAGRMERQIRKQREQVERLRTQVKALLANVKRLPPAQREQAARLLSKANEIERAANDLASQREQMLKHAEPERQPAVDVAGTLRPGVVLVFGLREAPIKQLIKGPVRVEERRVKGATEIAVVNQLTASIVVLPSVPVDVEDLEQAARGRKGCDEIG
jgi:uncharacterized protein (DUF342 family)